MRINSLYIIPILLLFQACSYLPSPEPNLLIDISEGPDYILLEKKGGGAENSAFIFYPGGLVDPHAYISQLSNLAESGRKIFILKVPANLAITAKKKGKNVTQKFPEVKKWIVGGHSLGGAVACMITEENPNIFSGLILFAAYPPENSDLSKWKGSALSLSAENDGLVSVSDIKTSEIRLPSPLIIGSLQELPTVDLMGQTIFHEIPGGNHSGFGNYGDQKGDGQRGISLEQQREEINAFLHTFFENNGW